MLHREALPHSAETEPGTTTRPGRKHYLTVISQTINNDHLPGFLPADFTVSLQQEQL